MTRNYTVNLQKYCAPPLSKYPEMHIRANAAVARDRARSVPFEEINEDFVAADWAADENDWLAVAGSGRNYGINKNFPGPHTLDLC